MKMRHILHIKLELGLSFLTVYFIVITILTKSTLFLFPDLAHGTLSSVLAIVYLVLSGVLAKIYYKKLDMFFHVNVFRNSY